MKKILITGAAGFIGFNLSKYLFKSKNFKIFGIDNLNDYYSKTLKLDRIKELKKFKNFKFQQIDLTNRKKLSNFFKRKKFSLIINLAAQAGVRYSLKKPTEFTDNNILGFYNIINEAHNNKIKKILYSSSSSVYGDNNVFPTSVKYSVPPFLLIAVEL